MTNEMYLICRPFVNPSSSSLALLPRASHPLGPGGQVRSPAKMSNASSAATAAAAASSSSSPPSSFTVLYFASAGSFAAREREAFPAPMPLSRLFRALEERHPGIRAAVLSSCLVTVNLDYVDVPEEDDGREGDQAGGDIAPAFVIKEGDEVAIIPPVSSG